jgi:hypothetical protein
MSTFQGSYTNDGTFLCRGMDHGSSRDGGRSLDHVTSNSRRNGDRGTSNSRRNVRHRSGSDYLARPRSITTESATNNDIMDDISEEDPNVDGNDWYME